MNEVALAMNEASAMIDTVLTIAKIGVVAVVVGLIATVSYVLYNELTNNR
jgi:hypothetical protein